jgi:hypothetical protein
MDEDDAQGWAHQQELEAQEYEQGEDDEQE